ncbi:class I SAM-dependent methyltransferase [Sulfurovum sp.]|uniref:class I SAM-dependent methyltransferase n=1 Tax=Sulfurovum sp. TaxID=1969726 RepID=UPI002867BA7C|nr:class I SAM-dependent methyltransferase [Sulfurovum sp.]
MNGKNDLKIFSYGCSTGEEVFTLRDYFPDAFIVGVDINKGNIKKAYSQNKDNKIIFSYDIERVCVQNGPFDIIFALAVFQRSDNRNESTFDSSKIYPFDKFNLKLTQLNSHLKPYGFFVIDHADYLFEDSDIARNFHFLKGNHTIVRERYLYNRNNRKMSDYVMSHRIFVKKKFKNFDPNS